MVRRLPDLLETFHSLNLQETYGGHAIHFLLLLFFMALTVMLFFSNGIILYAGLMRSAETDFLLAAPVPISAVFAYKYFEAMAYASWALLLLAIPLLAAFTAAGGLPLWFLPIFLVFLLTFIPIPAAAGAIVRRARRPVRPQAPGRVLAGAMIVLALGGVWWLIQLARLGPGLVGNPWQAPDRIFEKLQLVDHPLMPGYWLTRGLEHASNSADWWDFNFREAAFYFGVTLVNALFLNTWAVIIGSRVLRRMTETAAARRHGEDVAPHAGPDRRGRVRVPAAALAAAHRQGFAPLPPRPGAVEPVPHLPAAAGDVHVQRARGSTSTFPTWATNPTAGRAREPPRAGRCCWRG